MTLFAEIAGARVVDARIVVPRVGLWHADVTLDKEVAIKGLLELVVADFRGKCSLYRGAAYQGRTVARLIGGAGGWKGIAKARPYRLDVGVKLSLVIGDLAREVGELVRVDADRTLGPFYVREKEVAQRHLNRLASEWHVEAATGTTVIGPWKVKTAITSKFDLLSFDGDVAIVATETPGEWTPGRTFTSPLRPGPLKIGCVSHTISKGTLRTEVVVQ